MKKKQETDELIREIRTKRARRFKGNNKAVQKNKVPYISKDMHRLYKMSVTKKVDKENESNKSCPLKFSLIENPEITLKFISSIAELHRNTSMKSLNIDHSKIIYHDLGAEVFLGIAVKIIKDSAQGRNRKINIRGNLPNSERKKRLIRSMGVIKQLDIEHEYDVGSKLEIFDFVGSKNSSISVATRDRKNECTVKFVSHIDNCLNHSKKQLTDEARGNLVSYLGEIIGNAEDHSGENKWYVCGYLDHIDEKKTSDDDEDKYHFCEIVIYNFGKSITETFTELGDDTFPMKQVIPYINAHEKNGLFGQNWDKDTLITLAALQGCVSSKNLNSDMDRGQGTVDLIEFFKSISTICLPEAQQKPKMAIISGNTHIYFDGKYHIKSDDKGNDIIAFNLENSLNLRPDIKYVRKMKGVSFPGTVIAARFPISQKLLDI